MKKDPTAPLRIVLLEDDPNDAELVQLELARDGMAVQWRHVVSEPDFRDALAADRLVLVLADYTLPGFDGLAALRIALERAPDVPFIFVSGSLGEERAIEALKSGATDYVLKDRLQRLPTVVRRALKETRERRERRLAEAALEKQRVLLSTLIDSLPENIYAVDTENRVTIVNRALLDTLGRTREQVLGRRLSELSGEENMAAIEAQAATTMRTGRPLTDQERAWVSPDGAVRWFTFSTCRCAIKMVKDAEANAAEDKKRREAVDAKNHADGLVHSTEKALAEHGSKIPETDRRAIEDAVSDLKEALKGDDAEAIKAKTNTLAQASMKLGEGMYKQQAEADAAKDAAKDDVVDAEFTEVDDDKTNKKSA